MCNVRRFALFEGCLFICEFSAVGIFGLYDLIFNSRLHFIRPNSRNYIRILSAGMKGHEKCLFQRPSKSLQCNFLIWKFEQLFLHLLRNNWSMIITVFFFVRVVYFQHKLSTMYNLPLALELYFFSSKFIVFSDLKLHIHVVVFFVAYCITNLLSSFFVQYLNFKYLSKSIWRLIYYRFVAESIQTNSVVMVMKSWLCRSDLFLLSNPRIIRSYKYSMLNEYK